MPWLAAAAALVAAGYVSARGTGTVAAAPAGVGATTAGAVVAPTQAPKRPPTRVTQPLVTRTGLEITAARGDCWVEARAASALGKQLYFGLLRHGKTLRLRNTAVWVRLGAGANVDVLVDGKRQSIPNGTIVRVFRVGRI